MHSRTRKIAKTDSDFDTLHRQLNSDFEVHLYLQDQPSQHSNTNAYSSLLNSLFLHRRQRSQQLQKLKSTNRFASHESHSKQLPHFKDIEEMTNKEQEVKHTLQTEITEMKKSLNLLKGDIGHLVLRNESSQLLGSKVNKAKIIAEDQLKRVALALAKDREQIKITNQMQKKFKKKLKNVSSYESNGLNRVQTNYIQQQLRKEEAYKKLLMSEKMAQNGEQMALLLSAKNQIDEKNLYQRRTLLELHAIVQHLSLQKQQMPDSVQELFRKIDQFRQFFEPSETTENELEDAVATIISEHELIEESIKAMSEAYEEQLKIKEELAQKIEQCQREEEQLVQKFEVQLLQSYRISQEATENYQSKVKKLASNLKTLFSLITFLQERAEETKQSTESQLPPYVSNLHKIHQFLSSSLTTSSNELLSELSSTAIQSFYDSMIDDISGWLKEVQRQQKERKVNFQVRRPNSNQTNFTRGSYLLQPIPSQSYYEDLPSFKTPSPHEPTSPKTQNTSKAQRIQLLENVDSSYYKMLKSTIKMEKENTRKNYQFLRTFKRAKYASRDQILEEKRFEASFSVLFTVQSSQTNTRCLKTTNSIINQNSGTEKPFKTTHSSTHVSLRKKQAKVNTEAPPLRKVRSSMIGDKQYKIRLTQKLKLALDNC